MKPTPFARTRARRRLPSIARTKLLLASLVASTAVCAATLSAGSGDDTTDPPPPPPPNVCTITVNNNSSPWDVDDWAGGPVELCFRMYCDWFAGHRWVCVTFAPNTMSAVGMAQAIGEAIKDELEFCEGFEPSDVEVVDSTVIFRGWTVPHIPCGTPENPTKLGTQSKVALTIMKYAE